MQKRWKDQLARRFPRIAAPIRNFFRRLGGKPLVSTSGEPLIPRGRKELPAQMRVDPPLTREFLAGLELCVLDDPVVSVVIVSYERPDFVENLIKSIWLHSDGFRYEVIVVENGSEPGKLRLFLKSSGVCTSFACRTGTISVRPTTSASAGQRPILGAAEQRCRGAAPLALRAHRRIRARCCDRCGWAQAPVSDRRAARGRGIHRSRGLSDPARSGKECRRAGVQPEGRSGLLLGRRARAAPRAVPATATTDDGTPAITRTPISASKSVRAATRWSTSRRPWSFTSKMLPWRRVRRHLT